MPAPESIIELVRLFESNYDQYRSPLFSETKAPERAMLQNQIELTDRQIDRLVYDLYGLTADEIAVVDGAAAA